MYNHFTKVLHLDVYTVYVSVVFRPVNDGEPFDGSDSNVLFPIFLNTSGPCELKFLKAPGF